MTRKTTTAETRKTITVTAEGGWKFRPDAIALMGNAFPATYSVTKDGTVYGYAVMDGVAIRAHVAKGAPAYHDAFEAAMQYKLAAKAAKAKAETVPAKQERKAKHAKTTTEGGAKTAESATYKPKHAKAATKPAAKAAKPKAEPKAAKPAKQAKAEAKPAKATTEGGALSGNGWRFVFDEVEKRTRLVFDASPSEKQAAAIADAGFFWSPRMKSYNKKLSVKARKAAEELAATLSTL